MLHSFQRAGSSDKNMSFEFAVTHTHTYADSSDLAFRSSVRVLKRAKHNAHLLVRAVNFMVNKQSCTSCSYAKVVTYASALAWNEHSVFVGTIFKVIAEHKMQTENHKTKELLGFPLFTVVRLQHRHKMLGCYF